MKNKTFPDMISKLKDVPDDMRSHIEEQIEELRTIINVEFNGYCGHTFSDNRTETGTVHVVRLINPSLDYHWTEDQICAIEDMLIFYDNGHNTCIVNNDEIFWIITIYF